MKNKTKIQRQMDAEKKWLENNPEARAKKNINSLRSSAKRFLKEFATGEELIELVKNIKGGITMKSYNFGVLIAIVENEEKHKTHKLFTRVMSHPNPSEYLVNYLCKNPLKATVSDEVADSLYLEKKDINEIEVSRGYMRTTIEFSKKKLK